MWDIALMNLGRKKVPATPGAKPVRSRKSGFTDKQRVASKANLDKFNFQRRAQRDSDMDEVESYLSKKNGVKCFQVAVHFNWTLPKASDVLGNLKKQGRVDKKWEGRDCLWSAVKCQ